MKPTRMFDRSRHLILTGFLFFLSVCLVGCKARANVIVPKTPLNLDLTNLEKPALCQNRLPLERLRTIWNQGGSKAFASTALTENVLGQDDLGTMARLIHYGDAYALYDQEGFLNNLAMAAYYCNDNAWLETLLPIVEIPLQKLVVDPADGASKWFCNDPRADSVCKSNGLNGREVILYSSQYLGMAGFLYRSVASIPATQRSPVMRQYLELFNPVLKSHLLRWVKNSDSEYGELLRKFKLEKPLDVADAFGDVDLWVLCTVSNYLAAQILLSDQVGFTSDLVALVQYLQLGLRLLEKRLVAGQAKDQNGQTVSTFNFDPGGFSTYVDMQFANFTQSRVPTAKDKTIVEDLGMDVSHMRRLVPAILSLFENRKILKDNDFPNETILTGLANQLTYKAFVLETTWQAAEQHPLFTNYFNGSNGWYRFGYHKDSNGKTIDAGVCPSLYSTIDFIDQSDGPCEIGLSREVSLGGFAFWSPWNATLTKRFKRLSDLQTSTNAADQRFLKVFYYGSESQASALNSWFYHITADPSMVSVPDVP